MRPNLITAISTHLNAPYGPVVKDATVATLLSTGTFTNLKCDELELELLKTLFVECSPSLIGRACYQVGSGLDQAHSLYLELLKEGHPVVHRWEDAMKDIVT